MRALLLGLLLALPTVAAAVDPACAAYAPRLRDCAVGAGGISLVVDPSCSLAPPDTCWSSTQWYVGASACMDAPGALTIVYSFTLSDLPANAMVALSVPTGDPACPHVATVGRAHSGGAFHGPYECVHAVAAAPSGSATEIECMGT